jgi:hypothetical protein
VAPPMLVTVGVVMALAALTAAARTEKRPLGLPTLRRPVDQDGRRNPDSAIKPRAAIAGIGYRHG